MQVEILTAIYQNDLERIRKSINPSNVNEPLTTYLQTALHFAVRLNNKELITLLVKENLADVNRPDINGWTPLSLIAVEGSDSKYEIAQYLISLGADVDYSTRDSNYYSPFELARDSRDGCPEIFRLFKLCSHNKHWEARKKLLFTYENLSFKIV